MWEKRILDTSPHPLKLNVIEDKIVVIKCYWYQIKGLGELGQIAYHISFFFSLEVVQTSFLRPIQLRSYDLKKMEVVSLD